MCDIVNIIALDTLIDLFNGIIRDCIVYNAFDKLKLREKLDDGNYTFFTYTFLKIKCIFLIC